MYVSVCSCLFVPVRACKDSVCVEFGSVSNCCGSFDVFPHYVSLGSLQRGIRNQPRLKRILVWEARSQPKLILMFVWDAQNWLSAEWFYICPAMRKTTQKSPVPRFFQILASSGFSVYEQMICETYIHCSGDSSATFRLTTSHVKCDP